MIVSDLGAIQVPLVYRALTNVLDIAKKASVMSSEKVCDNQS